MTVTNFYGNKPNMQRKQELVDEILDNPVYLPDSKIREQLTKQLCTKISLVDLENLKLILSLKEPKIS